MTFSAFLQQMNTVKKTQINIYIKFEIGKIYVFERSVLCWLSLNIFNLNKQKNKSLNQKTVVLRNTFM